MRRALAVALLCLAVPAVALAVPPTRVTVIAVFDPLTHGETAYVNGQLVGDEQAGQLVTLEQALPPFTEWTPVLQTTSDWAGYYSFKAGKPAQTMQYRTSSQGVPSERVVQVNVAPRIRLESAPAGRTSVRYSGTFAPALPGQSVEIQRRDGRRWVVVANARLSGSGRTFAGRLRTRRGAILRAYYRNDGLRLDGVSKAILALPQR